MDLIPDSRKRNKTSRPELAIAIQAIKNLIVAEEEAAKLVEKVEETEGESQEMDDEVSLTLYTVLNMLTKSVRGPQTYSFPSIGPEVLNKLRITYAGRLDMKDDFQSRTANTDSIGEDHDWSAEKLYRHLCFLEKLVPRTNEAAARLWINAFFFRVAVMLSGTPRFVLAVEPNRLPAPVGSNSFLSGFVNFMAFSTTDEHAAAQILKNNQFENVPGQVLFVTEAKGPDQRLDSHVPRAVSELYACARHLGKKIIRGALTNGREWIFFLLKCHEGKADAKYYESPTVILMNVTSEISRENTSLVAAIIAHWIQHSHDDIRDDDFFTVI